MRRFLLALLFWGYIFIQSGYSQNAPTSKKAREFYDKAQKAWQDRQLNEAAVLYDKVLQAEPNHPESNLRLAQINDLLKNTDLTKKYYTRFTALQPTSPQSAAAYQWIGKYFFQQEKYDSAQVYYEKALTLFPAKSSLLRLAEKSVTSAKFAQQAIKNPLKIQKEHLAIRSIF